MTAALKTYRKIVSDIIGEMGSIDKDLSENKDVSDKIDEFAASIAKRIFDIKTALCSAPKKDVPSPTKEQLKPMESAEKSLFGDDVVDMIAKRTNNVEIITPDKKLIEELERAKKEAGETKQKELEQEALKSQGKGNKLEVLTTLSAYKPSDKQRILEYIYKMAVASCEKETCQESERDALISKKADAILENVLANREYAQGIAKKAFMS